jgi:hypothetical protein
VHREADMAELITKAQQAVSEKTVAEQQEIEAQMEVRPLASPRRGATSQSPSNTALGLSAISTSCGAKAALAIR